MAEKEAVVIILDVGKNAGEKKGNSEQTFFEKAKDCISKIIQRKIFGKPKDELGLVLMGTEATNNQLNSMGGYDNITEAFDLAITNFQMLRILEKDINSNNVVQADWLDALIVAMNFLKVGTENKKITSKKIVLFTTFSTRVNPDSVDEAIAGLKQFNIELSVISDNVEVKNDDSEEDNAVFSQCVDKSNVQSESEQLIGRILTETNGSLCHFEYAVLSLMYFTKRKVRAMPWNCPLTIGSNFEINISVYKYITDESAIKSWKTDSIYDQSVVQSKTEYFKNDKPLDIEMSEPGEEGMSKLIKGYMYGTTEVPFDESTNIKFKSGAKCFMCIGFTDQIYLPEEYLTGKGSNVVLAQNSYPGSEKMMAALVKAMIKANTAMIVRRVYNKDSAPKLMALLPTYHEKYPCFSMMELQFAEDCVFFDFPKFRGKKNAPTDEQIEAIGNLIDVLDLENAIDDDSGVTEAFAYKKTLDPANQYIFNMIAHRALRPQEPLPKPNDELLALMEIPKKLKEQSVNEIEKIKEIFPLEKVVNKQLEIYMKNKYSMATKTDEDSTPIPDDVNNLMEVGSISPAEDFIFLLKRGEKFATLCVQIQNVISDLIFKSIEIQRNKVCGTIMTYREEAKVMGAFRYNEWILNFKKDLLNRGKEDFFTDVIVKEEFGLISAKDTSESAVTEEEVVEFYKSVVDTNKESKEDEYLENVDDLFDDM